VIIIAERRTEVQSAFAAGKCQHFDKPKFIYPFR